MNSDISDDRLYVLVGLILLSIFIVVLGSLQALTEVDLLTTRLTAGFVLGYLVNLAVWFLVYGVLRDVEEETGDAEAEAV